MKQLIFISMFFFAFSYISQATEDRIQSKGYAIMEKGGSFKPYSFTRHAVGDNDILIDILYAGLCHSDVHHVKSDWREEQYPMVPGHEIVGIVKEVGKKVKHFKVGDYAGIGCLVNSCRSCENCQNHEEQYCEDGRVLTYASKDYYHNNELTQGGYSDNMVVSEDFAIKVPKNADLSKVAPLLCAGITTYSPIKSAKIEKNAKVGVAGFGGLGHMAVQYLVAKGANVTVFDITDEKCDDALKMGAKNYINVNKIGNNILPKNEFDFMISTIPNNYEIGMYMSMLKMNGEFIIVGLPAFKSMPSINVGTLINYARRKVSGSQIGGIKETQEMLDYSISHGIYPNVEIINIQSLDSAYKNIIDGKVKFRYVIDMQSLKNNNPEHKGSFMNNETQPIFKKGEKLINPNFIGTPWLSYLVESDTTFNCPIANVSFEPGTRNSWHRHSGGQILLVTDGVGCYQEKDGVLRLLKRGDVVKIMPNIIHWHGATPRHFFSHIAIEPNSPHNQVEWLDPVDDKTYNALDFTQ